MIAINNQPPVLPSCASLSERAIVARVNRKLAHQGQRLRTFRYGSRSFYEVGRFIVVDQRNFLRRAFSDLANLTDFARELKAI